MSTYIVAFANGIFEYLESSYQSSLSGKVRPLRIYGIVHRYYCRSLYWFLIALATSDLISQAQYALDVKTKVVPVYEQLFDIEYPLPKLDTLLVRHISSVTLLPTFTYRLAFCRLMTSTLVSSVLDATTGQQGWLIGGIRRYGKLGRILSRIYLEYLSWRLR